MSQIMKDDENMTFNDINEMSQKSICVVVSILLVTYKVWSWNKQKYGIKSIYTRLSSLMKSWENERGRWRAGMEGWNANKQRILLNLYLIANDNLTSFNGWLDLFYTTYYYMVILCTVKELKYLAQVWWVHESGPGGMDLPMEGCWFLPHFRL